ncbi:ion transporter [candidate division KSB1 bacterium]|nr:ion transporter [candidate division KSB1 bacterium]
MPFVILFFKKLYQRIRFENVPRLVFVTFFIILFGAVGVFYFEHRVNDNIVNMIDAVWWSLVTITTVGYGDIFPVTLGGRIVAVVVMLMGIGFLGMFTATIASMFVEQRLKAEKGLRAVKVMDHLIICGWNHRAQDIINEIRAHKGWRTEKIVLIADIDSKPIDDDRLYFVKGEVTEDNLKRANLAEASNIIILADEKLDPRSRDAKTILNTLTVESLHQDVYTCVEIENSENVAHCRRAKADEIIVSGEFSSKLIARAALNHGISKFIDELLSSQYGEELHKIKAPDSMVGKRFIDIFVQLKEHFDCIVVAIESEPAKAFISNPPSGYEIKKGDHLILVSKEIPEFD